MKLQLELFTDTKDYNQAYEQIGNKIHESLAGNAEYIDSRIVLNVGDTDDATTYLGIIADEIPDKELIREKAKQAIDLFVDSL